MPGNNGHDRLDRIEATLEQLTGNFNRLASAMLGLTEHLERLTRHAEQVDARIAALTAAQQRNDERVDKLVGAIGEFIRRSDKGLSS